MCLSEEDTHRSGTELLQQPHPEQQEELHPNSVSESCHTLQYKRTEEEGRKSSIPPTKFNGYPRNFIRRSLKKRIPNQQQNVQPQEEQNQITKRIALPYIKNISELTARLLKPYGIMVAHKPYVTLRKLLSKSKDKIDLSKKTNVVYQVNCGDCNKFYVGQTGRRLETRITEHKAAIRRHDPLSLISVHEDKEGHKFNLDSVKIIAQGNTRHTREFLEAWYSTTNSINRHVELDPVYIPLRMKGLRRDRQSRGGSIRRTRREERENNMQTEENTGHVTGHEQTDATNHVT